MQNEGALAYAHRTYLRVSSVVWKNTQKESLRMKYHIYSPLQIGSEDEQVKQLQRSLPTWTTPNLLSADGIFGSKTQAAVKAYQSAMELPVDGIVGQTTASALGLWVELEKGFDASHWQNISWDDFKMMICLLRFSKQRRVGNL